MQAAMEEMRRKVAEAERRESLKREGMEETERAKLNETYQNELKKDGGATATGYAEGQSAHRYSAEERAQLEKMKKDNIEAAQSKRKIYLRVPYKEKKTAIGFGAFFDTARVRWAIAEDVALSLRDVEPFCHWLPDDAFPTIYRNNNLACSEKVVGADRIAFQRLTEAAKTATPQELRQQFATETMNVEPHTAALHVLVRSGRDILPMDGSKDDPGGLSDPYCEVILEHEKSGKFETEQTHYIDDVDAPEWERKFSFVISRPYTQNTLWFKVYDFDGGFDELIGQVQIKCEDLDIHEGFDKPPPAKWLTLLDTSGNSKNSDGDPYGEILVSAYIDEEYLEHLHLQKVHAADEPKIGELEVDIFKIHDLPEDVASAGDVFCVVKYGPYWTRFPTKDAEDGQVAFDLRSLFPVLDMHVPVIVAAFTTWLTRYQNGQQYLTPGSILPSFLYHRWYSTK